MSEQDSITVEYLDENFISLINIEANIITENEKRFWEIFWKKNYLNNYYINFIYLTLSNKYNKWCGNENENRIYRIYFIETEFISKDIIETGINKFYKNRPKNRVIYCKYNKPYIEMCLNTI